jgi:hypothetical protein
VSTLAGQLDDYLRLRRGLGFQLGQHGSVLPGFVAYAAASGAETVTVELAVTWARLPAGIKPVTAGFRLSQVRGFARYLHAIDPAHQVPPPGLPGVPRRRPTPCIYTPGQIAEILRTTQRLQPPLRAATYRTLPGLLAATGMRLGGGDGAGPRRRRPRGGHGHRPAREVRPDTPRPLAPAGHPGVRVERVEQAAVDRVGTGRGIRPAGLGDRLGHHGFPSVLIAQLVGRRDGSGDQAGRRPLEGLAGRHAAPPSDAIASTVRGEGLRRTRRLRAGCPGVAWPRWPGLARRAARARVSRWAGCRRSAMRAWAR